MALDGIKALTFDVFGTVVDWRSGIIREGDALGARKGLELDWARFADAWRGLYQPMLSKVRNGEMPWTNLDSLHRMSLDRLLGEFGIGGLSEAEIDDFSRAWHRLDPWVRAENGRVRVPQGPGLGCDPDPHTLERYRLGAPSATREAGRP